MRWRLDGGTALDIGPRADDGIPTGGQARQSDQGGTGRRGCDRFTAFRSPSSNIGCYLKADYVRCDIDGRNWTPPPRPADCEWDYGQGITMVPGGSAEFICAGDTALVPDGDPLPYGESMTAGPLRCDSAESGITCRDTGTGKGFSISRDAYQLF